MRKRSGAEFLGTFPLVFGGCGAVYLAQVLGAIAAAYVLYVIASGMPGSAFA